MVLFNKKMNETLENYWSKLYEEDKTGWDIGHVSTPIATYIDQLEDKTIKILIPGAGNSYEAEYLQREGFENVHVLDISKIPLDNLKERVPSFPKEHLIQSNFFELSGAYDLILEQTFFCSFEPTKENRTAYALQMKKLLKPGGKLVGLWFKHPLNINGGRPFGGSKPEYVSYLEPYFKVKIFEDAHNSIKPRLGNELFGIFEKR